MGRSFDLSEDDGGVVLPLVGALTKAFFGVLFFGVVFLATDLFADVFFAVAFFLFVGREAVFFLALVVLGERSWAGRPLPADPRVPGRLVLAEELLLLTFPAVPDLTALAFMVDPFFPLSAFLGVDRAFGAFPPPRVALARLSADRVVPPFRAFGLALDAMSGKGREFDHSDKAEDHTDAGGRSLYLPPVRDDGRDMAR
ncbi:MAG: hypothetical protein H6595_11220 [Flavobacteriales bacterium]|nr:hypothetical protein [Flavobacteriales bacterium]MCB9168030.1 hypothetical protein [Flavobacteriales bacterium]